jgi:hypothetical protein
MALTLSYICLTICNKLRRRNSVIERPVKRIKRREEARRDARAQSNRPRKRPGRMEN